MTEITHVLPPSDTCSRHAANMGVRRNYNDYAAAKSTSPAAVHSERKPASRFFALLDRGSYGWNPDLQNHRARELSARKTMQSRRTAGRISERQAARGPQRAAKRRFPVRVIPWPPGEMCVSSNALPHRCNRHASLSFAMRSAAARHSVVVEPSSLVVSDGASSPTALLSISLAPIRRPTLSPQGVHRGIGIAGAKRRQRRNSALVGALAGTQSE
jgi:hypothetical protein